MVIDCRDGYILKTPHLRKFAHILYIMSCHVASYRIVRIVSHRIILYHTYIISYRIVTYHMSYHILHHISYIILCCIHNFSRTEAAVVLIMPHVATGLLLSLMLNPIEAAVVPAPRPRHMVQRFYLSVCFFFYSSPPFSCCCPDSLDHYARCNDSTCLYFGANWKLQLKIHQRFRLVDLELTLEFPLRWITFQHVQK